MAYTPIPHTADMTEEQNDTRNALNEYAFAKHCIEMQYDEIQILQDKLVEATRILHVYQDDAIYQYDRLVEQGRIEEVQ